MPTLASPEGLSTGFPRQFHFAHQWLATNFRVLFKTYPLALVSSHFLRFETLPNGVDHSGRQLAECLLQRIILMGFSPNRASARRCGGIAAMQAPDGFQTVP